MPELPEVETVRRGLAPVFEGALIERVEQRRPDLRFPFPQDFSARLAGRRVLSVGRRAKYLILHLDDDTVLVCHLGMSGSFRIEFAGDGIVPGVFHHDRTKLPAHDHVIFHLKPAEGGTARVVFNDPRRFGFMFLSTTPELERHPLLAGLGIEPTGNRLDGAVLSVLMQGKAAPLKAALLDQRLIAGLGNIYVCEALWRARLSPRRAAGTIAGRQGKATARSERLAESIRAVIADAVAAGGSSLRDHRQADGSLGYFQHSFSVYDRAGHPCPRVECNGVVQRIVQSGRSTFYCPVCQR